MAFPQIQFLVLDQIHDNTVIATEGPEAWRVCRESTYSLADGG